MDPTITKIKQYIQENNLISKYDRLLLSVSAGKDSMALLEVLGKLQNELGFELALFHLNHMTRGRESDDDEKFIIQIARERDLTLYRKSHNFYANDVKKKSFEEQARDVRYEMLNEICQVHGATKIVTAHNFDDTIETMLMRMFTGTGLRGLRGIAASRNNIIRPLLCVNTVEIYGFLKRNAILWREDSSNASSEYKRNYIRNELVPRIKDAFPMYASSLQLLSQVATEHVQYLDEKIQQEYASALEYNDAETCILLEKIPDNFVLLHLLSTVLRERYDFQMNRSVAQEVKKNICVNAAHVLLYGNTVIEIRKTHYKQKSYIKISPAIKKSRNADWEYPVIFDENAEKKIVIPEISAIIVLKVIDFECFKENYSLGDKKYVFVSIDPAIENITIRNRRDGDVITLEAGTQKIKKYFIEKKLDNEIKNCVPLLIVNSTIAVIMSAFVNSLDNRVSRDFLITNKTKKILALYKE